MQASKFLFLSIIGTLFTFSNLSMAQNKQLYDPNANAIAGIQEAMNKAKAENKHVFIQAGGNWCSWCIAFDKFTKENPVIDSLLQADYVVYHLNYSKENTNDPVFRMLEYPQRFGFPVFIITDANGKRLHTQNSAYLEDGKSYHLKHTIEFLKAWNTRAIDHKTYLPDLTK